MTKLKRIILCLTLCLPLVLPLTMKTVNAESYSFPIVTITSADRYYNGNIYEYYNYVNVYGYNVVCSDGIKVGFPFQKAVENVSYDYRNPDGVVKHSTALVGNIYVWSDSNGNKYYTRHSVGENFVLSGVPEYYSTYASTDILNDLNIQNNIFISFFTGNFSDKFSPVPVAPPVSIGYLNNIKYVVNKQSSLRESTDIISWNNETDSNDNIFDATWTVDLSVIPVDCVASSEEDWYKKSLFDWQMNSQTILTHTIPATNGSIEVKWSEIIDNNSDIKGWLESILDAKDINYNAHAWVYRVRLNKGSQNGEWETVYPFVAGTPSEVEKAMPATTYNSSVLNTLNSLAITTTNTDNTTNISSVDYTYNYYITNQYDNSTKTEYNIDGSSDPNGNNIDNSLGGTVIKSLIDRIIDLFNIVINFVAGVIFGTVTSAAKGFIAKTGFIGESASMLPQMFRLLTNYVFSPSECVLSWSNVDLLGTTLINGGSINLDEVVRQSNLTELHNLCRIVLDGGLIVYTMQRVYRKGIQLLNL